MITEMQQRADGKHAKRNKLGHVVTILKIGYQGRHRLWLYSNVDYTFSVPNILNRAKSYPLVAEQYYGGSVERFE